MYNYARIYNDDNKGVITRRFDITSHYDSKQILKDIIKFNKLDKEEFMSLCKEVCEELPF